MAQPHPLVSPIYIYLCHPTNEVWGTFVFHADSVRQEMVFSIDCRSLEPGLSSSEIINNLYLSQNISARCGMEKKEKQG